jgi:hypothetical protein
MRISLFLFLLFAISLHSYGQYNLDSLANNSERSTELYAEDKTTYEALEEEYISESEEEEKQEKEESSLLTKRTISKSKWEKVLNDSSFKYSKSFEKKKNSIKKEPILTGTWSLFVSSALKVILFVLVILAVLFVVYTVFSNGQWNFKNLFKREPKPEQNILPDQVTEFKAWELALHEALRIPDYRLAVRIHYLNCLQELHEKGKIRFEIEKTNWDYIHELSNGHKKEFIVLTKYFEYIWYGEFSLDEARYLELKQRFKQFNQL